MSDTFNPYRNWLGLNTEHPVSHYELLGLRPFESDVQTITFAADRAINQLRGVRPGEYATQWSQLLDQLSAAKHCLTDPVQRSRYDQELRTRSPAPAGPAGVSYGSGGQPAVAPAELGPQTLSDLSANMYPPGMGAPGGPAAHPVSATQGGAPSPGPAGSTMPTTPGTTTAPGPVTSGQAPGGPVATPSAPTPAMPAQTAPGTTAETPASVPTRPQPRSETPAMPPGKVPMSAPNDPSYQQGSAAIPTTGPIMVTPEMAGPYAMPNAAAGGYDPSLPQGGQGVYGAPNPAPQQHGVMPQQGLPAAQPWGTPPTAYDGQAVGQPYAYPGQMMPQTPAVWYPQSAAQVPDGYYYDGGYPMPAQPAMGQPVAPQFAPQQPVPPMAGFATPATPYAGPATPQDPYAATYPAATPAPIMAPTPAAYASPPSAPVEQQPIRPAHAADGADPMAPVNPLLIASGGTLGIGAAGPRQSVSPALVAKSRTPAAALPSSAQRTPDAPIPASGAKSTPAGRRSTTLPIIIGASVGGLAALLIAWFFIFGRNSGDDNGVVNSQDDEGTIAAASDNVFESTNGTDESDANDGGTNDSNANDGAASGRGGAPGDSSPETETGDDTSTGDGANGDADDGAGPASSSAEADDQTTLPATTGAAGTDTDVTTTTDQTPPSSAGRVPFATSEGQDAIPDITPSAGGATTVEGPAVAGPPASNGNPGNGGAPVAAPSDSELADLGRALTRVKTALGARDFLRASRELANAERLAKLPEHQAKVERLKKLVNYTQQFWQAFQEGLQGLRATEEIEIDDSRVNVVEINPQRIILKAAGQTRTYPMTDLPSKLVVAIADRWFDQNDPASKVMKGAYYATGPDADPTEARRLWDEAQRAGIDVGDLAEVLSDAYDLTR